MRGHVGCRSYNNEPQSVPLREVKLNLLELIGKLDTKKFFDRVYHVLQLLFDYHAVEDHCMVPLFN